MTIKRIAYAIAWLVWIGAIVGIVVPWNDFQDHTHWAKVGWIPFASPPLKPSDIAGNLLLYVPLGYLGHKAAAGAVPRWAIGGVAALLSIATEATQLYSHWRFPSATDVTANLLGCAAGLYVASAARRNRDINFRETLS